MANRSVNLQEAISVLATYGVIARTSEEAELLECFRRLPSDVQKMEVARANGMIQAYSYVSLIANEGGERSGSERNKKA